MFANAKLLGTSALAGLLLAGTAIAKDVPMGIANGDDDTSIFVIEANLDALGFAAVHVTDQRGSIFDVSAMWEGRPLTLRVDAERERITVMSASKPAGDGVLPTHVALFGDNTMTYTARSELERLGFDNVEVTDRRGGVFHARALWNDTQVRLRVDADLGRIQDVAPAHAMSPDAMPDQVGIADDDTTPYIVAKRLRDLGYTDIAMRIQKGDVFYGTAIWNGTQRNLRIDAVTGRISAL